MLLNVNIPSALGFTTALTNIGKVRNRGFEFPITSRNLVGAFDWTTDFNISTNANMDTTYVNRSGEVTSGRWVIRYDSEPFTDQDSDNNFVVLRYADVLLMLAEALGESPEAYDLINQVCARAGLAPIDASTPGTFEDKLLQERRVELAFENHRWFDLRPIPPRSRRKSPEDW